MGLKQELKRRDVVSQVVSVHNPLAAKIAEEFRFDWVSVGGYNTSGSNLGIPDVGLLTLMEQVEMVRKVAEVTTAPLLADGDDGYGNYLNVMRLVREMEKAGANAIHMEDQVFPKKCGHMEGKRVVPQRDFVAKIKAFVDTRKSEDFLLFARTDAIAVGGFQDAVDRANAYLEAGADVIFVEAPQSEDEIVRLMHDLSRSDERIVLSVSAYLKTRSEDEVREFMDKHPKKDIVIPVPSGEPDEVDADLIAGVEEALEEDK